MSSKVELKSLYDLAVLLRLAEAKLLAKRKKRNLLRVAEEKVRRHDKCVVISNQSGTGAIGPTGPTGATGATGATPTAPFDLNYVVLPTFTSNQAGYKIDSVYAGSIYLDASVRIKNTLTLPIGVWIISYQALGYAVSVNCFLIADLYDGSGTILFSCKDGLFTTEAVCCNACVTVAVSSGQDYTMRCSLSNGIATATLGIATGENYMFAYRLA